MADAQMSPAEERLRVALLIIENREDMDPDVVWHARKLVEAEFNRGLNFLYVPRLERELENEDDPKERQALSKLHSEVTELLRT